MKARENPFRVARVDHLRLRLLNFSLDELLHRLEKQNWRGAILGKNGSGKTRLMNILISEFHERNFRVKKIFLNEENRKISWTEILADSHPLKTILCIDGSEQLSPLDRFLLQAFARCFRGVVVTAHHESIFPALIKMETSSELLDELISELVQDDLLKKHFNSEELFQKHRGNVRDALRECFDVCGDLPSTHSDKSEALVP